MTSSAPTADAFAERLLASTLGAFEVMGAYLGDRLGYYRALADAGPATASELAERTGTHERYAREWLEQQAVTGILVAEPGDEHERRYELPPGPAEVLLDPSSLAYLGPATRMLVGAARRTPELLEAYRTGGGVPWEAYGADVRESQSDVNRPVFDQLLGPALAGVPDVHERLSAPGARILEVGCGGGWASIALARAYPRATVEGADVDAPSIDLAGRNLADAAPELADRVRFRTVDGETLATDEPYDAAFAFECVHDMARPVEVLRAVRGSVRDDAVVVVMDEAVADEFTAPGDDVERFMYGWSILVCLPDGMSSKPSAGTGTVMRRATLERYATEAGFSRVEVLPIEGVGFFRFYRLHP